MKSVRLSVIILLLFTLTVPLFACRPKKQGMIEGSIAPPPASARIVVFQNGKEVIAVPGDASNGKYRVALAAGMYSIKVMASDAPYPVNLSDIAVKPGETTTLPPIEFISRTGKAILTGKILPPRQDADVTLINEGRLRASVHPDQEGNYELRDLPAGRYDVQINTPGHARDFAHVVAAEGQMVVQNAVLFPISQIDGVDWTTGKIHATGVGIPPLNTPNTTVSREMTKRAALVDAQRNMLRTVERIRLNADQSVQTVMGNPKIAIRIQGFLKGYTVISERELEGGKIEIVLELPLNGPSGLSRSINSNTE